MKISMLLMVGIGAIPAKKGTRDHRTIVKPVLTDKNVTNKGLSWPGGPKDWSEDPG